MITTPILDFVRNYAASGAARLHMPGHKGAGVLGCEALDITEIDGADELYAPGGIIAESEQNASALFGADTYYSCEGSSLAIRAMLMLALSTIASPSGAGAPGTAGSNEAVSRPLVLAGRNAHRAFLSAAALLDFDVAWLNPAPGDAYHSCTVTAEGVDAALARLNGRCRVVYLTSPDYLGHIADIESIAKVCRAHGALLLVDNAHGAYLRFLPGGSRHPMDLGADLCCDSAHKTLPALTGAAYLHVHPRLGLSPRRVKAALSMFGSSSPSWLILQSLDACNRYLETFPEALKAFLEKLAALKAALAGHGYALVGDEPMKLTIAARCFGYTGDALAEILRGRGIYSEFHDPDFLTLMPAPANTDADLLRVRDALLAVPRRPALEQRAPEYRAPFAAMGIRDAAFAPRETLPARACLGRVLAAPALSCPPCVPVAVCGEAIDEAVLERLKYYGIESCEVVAE